jgi:transposase
VSTRRLSDFDLQQLTAEYVASLSVAAKDRLIGALADDLRAARDRLKQDSRTSSRPPRNDPPWQGSPPAPEDTDEPEDVAGAEGEQSAEQEATDAPDERADGDEPSTSSGDPPKKRGQPGRREGMKGYGRQVVLPVTDEVIHHPTHCHGCGEPACAAKAKPWTAIYVVDLLTRVGLLLGLQVTHIKHVYTESLCSCGHVTRAEPGRCDPDPEWPVALSEWHLVGPTLVSLIVSLHKRQHSSRRRTQEFLQDWLGIYLSTSTINQCIHEAGRAVAPVEDQLVDELLDAPLIHADETPWKEAGQLLWLWVFCSSTVTLYLIGYRSKEIIQNLLGSDFAGWLMTDGYRVYRDFARRLRCWAHLIRKARALQQSLDVTDAQPFGNATLRLLNELMEAVYQAREGPPTDLLALYSNRLERFKALCNAHRDCLHEQTRALAREFLNDWDAIWTVLQFPSLPLTNNVAERALRHWVFARLISHGTRTDRGTRSFGLLASVIDTCRKRGISPWPYIAHVIAERRKGNPAPPLPQAASS